MEAVSTAEFTLLGGWPCLDFANTADGDMNATWTERLETYEDLLNWSTGAGVLNAEKAERLRTMAQQLPAAAQAALYDARHLRAIIFRVFSAVAHGETPDLSAFNNLLSAALARQQMVATAEGFTWKWTADANDLDAFLWPVLWSAAALLLAPERELVRECDGPTCSWLFLDTSRNHSRRWCSMESCGNRAKARRHYHRQTHSDAS